MQQWLFFELKNSAAVCFPDKIPTDSALSLVQFKFLGRFFFRKADGGGILEQFRKNLKKILPIRTRIFDC